MRHGPGTMDFVDRSQYVGDWCRDKRVGLGTFRLANGDRYEGVIHILVIN